MTKLGRGFDCVLMGEQSLFIQCGEILRQRGHRIALVIADSPAVMRWAEGHGAPVVRPGDRLQDAVSRFTFDWFFSIANLRLVPNAVWSRARAGAINFHDGPLPDYAGLNTPAWAILGGETRHGVTWHAMTDGIDEGDIFVQRVFEMTEGETALSLNAKCFAAGIDSFAELVEQIEAGTLVGVPQNFATRKYFSKSARPGELATIDFSAKTAAIDRLARALDFGADYRNPLALPKIRVEQNVFNVKGLGAATLPAALPPGTIASVDASGAVIATADAAVRIHGLTDAGGVPQPLTTLTVGDRLYPLAPEMRDRLADLSRGLAPHESFFLSRLAVRQDVEIPGLQPASGQPARLDRLTLELPHGLPGERAVAALLAGLVRTTGAARLHVALTDDALAALAGGFGGFVAPSVPLVVAAGNETTGAAFAAAVGAELEVLRRRRGYFCDLVDRSPQIPKRPDDIAIRLAGSAGDPVPAGSAPALTFVVPAAAGPVTLIFDTARLRPADAKGLLSGLQAAIAAFVDYPEMKIEDLPLMTVEEQQRIVRSQDQTARDYDRTALLHQLIEAQVDRTPDATAVVCGGQSLSYRELDLRANRVAETLIAMGAGPEAVIGLYMQRSCDLVVGALAILKTGAAYLPLDPSYPRDRIELIVEDSGLEMILTQQQLAAKVPVGAAKVVTLEAANASARSSDRPMVAAVAGNLAYVIYTSGSTGRPKGVMVEHRNVTNFFAGMDERVARPDVTGGDASRAASQPVWLAVTSLSFDISVLELFWTLARGFKVIIHVDDKSGTAPPARRKSGPGPIDFSLYYWGHGNAVGPSAYHLLLEGARYVDSRGFRAVWMPERHFHAFGGQYPNPSVTGAAVAAITSTVEIRSGSCVLALHHPARVAEEWAVVDNISNGRVGLGFASGWMPEDFVLRPENGPPNNKTAMLRDIDVVRRLWRGEKVRFPGAGGGEVEIQTFPRPVSGELAVWLATAGNADTYREAARQGCHILTHLLGQSIDELADRIRIYREALVEAGRNPADYKVTLMLHTLIGHDRDVVRDLARGPMKEYLKSAAGLIKQYAWMFPAFKRPAGTKHIADIDLQTLTEEELDAIVEFAFLRYFDHSGLFGNVDDAIARVGQVKAIGVDEIACLIDFGVSSEVALDGLALLAERVVPVTSRPATIGAADEAPVGALIRAHGVTHMQFTPAMAAMLLMNDADRAALASVRHLYVGGEALTGALLKDLRQSTAATIENMYGPTETTVWSTTGPARDTETTVPLGTPIANTQIYVLDDRRRLVPPGVPGQLYIGGDGVTRGYRNRDDLTAERFIADPFRAGSRLYGTGDVVRMRRDGHLEFIGRSDHQVKVRGYRIELGEIEARLAAHPGVAEAVVVARQDKADDVRIVAYVRPRSGAVPGEELRAHVRQSLPDFMVPAHFVTMSSFPLTPNAKVDRKALPPPEKAIASEPARPEFVAPDCEVQTRIAESFKRCLGIETIGVNDNFFTHGGHSLLAVQLHRDLKAGVAPDLSITDIYRFPTVGGLASHIGGRGQDEKRLGAVADRAAMRRNAMAARRGGATRP